MGGGYLTFAPTVQVWLTFCQQYVTSQSLFMNNALPMPKRHLPN